MIGRVCHGMDHDATQVAIQANVIAPKMPSA